MAVLGFLFRSQLGKCFFNLRKIKERIITEAIHPAWSVEDHPISSAAKQGQRFSITRDRQHTDKSSSTLSKWDILQFVQNARIVGSVIGVRIGLVGLLILQGGSRVASGVHAGSAVQRVDLQAGVVGDNDFSRNVSAVGLGLLSSIGLESKTILNNGGQGSEVRNAGDFDPVP